MERFIPDEARHEELQLNCYMHHVTENVQYKYSSVLKLICVFFTSCLFFLSLFPERARLQKVTAYNPPTHTGRSVLLVVVKLSELSLTTVICPVAHTSRPLSESLLGGVNAGHHEQTYRHYVWDYIHYSECLWTMCIIIVIFSTLTTACQHSVIHSLLFGMIWLSR